jgi:hypothetical protein
VGQFEWSVCAFGLIGSPGIWNRLMLKLFGPDTRFSAYTRAFVDDLSVRSGPEDTLDQHLVKVASVLKELAANGLFANLSKCVIAATSVKHLGQIVGRHGISIDGARVEAVLEWPRPQTHAELRTFLGTTTYLSRHIPGYSELAAPLSRIKNGRPGKGGSQPSFGSLWTGAHDAAFAALKVAVTSAPVLQSPDFSQRFFLQADSSKTSFGCALLQQRGDILLPVAFASRPLSKAEVKWPIFDLEFGAMCFGAKQFRPYLLHAHLQWVALSDHAPLVHWQTPGSSLTLRQIRQLDFLSQFDFRWEYLPGKKMVFADMLSRPPGCAIQYDAVQPNFIDNDCAICNNACGHDAGKRIAASLMTTAATATSVVGIDDIDVERIVQHYHADPYTAKIVKSLGPLSSKQSHFHDRYQQLPSGLILVRTLIDGGDPRVLLPAVSAVTMPILTLYHDGPSSGHTGITSTYKRVRKRFFCVGLLRLVERHVARCDVCRQNQVRSHAPYGLARPLEIPEVPGASLSTDFAFSLPPSKCPVTGAIFRGIQVYVCRLTKRVRLLPCNESITSKQAAALYAQGVLPIFGMMTSLVSDRDPRFTSVFWRQLSDLLGVKLKMSTARHPQSDGQSEQTIRWVKQILRALCDKQEQWLAMLPFVELVINTTPTLSRNGSTPMQIFQGFDPILPQDLLASATLSAVGVAAKDRFRFQQRAMLAARDAIQTAQDSAAYLFNQGRIDIPFKVGDWVRVKKTHLVPATERDPETKLSLRRPWPGPFQIVSQHGPNAFELDLPRGAYPNTSRTINVSALEPEVATRPSDLAAGGQSPVPDTTGRDTWLVDKIIGHRIRRRRHEYAIRWAGTGPGHDEWKPIDSFQDGAATTQALLDFEESRLGDNRHVDAAAGSVSYAIRPSGTQRRHEDGWQLWFAHNNDSLLTLGRQLHLDPKLLQDFNLALYSGLTLKSKLSRGTAIRIRSPARPDVDPT